MQQAADKDDQNECQQRRAKQLAQSIGQLVRSERQCQRNRKKYDRIDQLRRAIGNSFGQKRYGRNLKRSRRRTRDGQAGTDGQIN